jgi:hypothetical protein
MKPIPSLRQLRAVAPSNVVILPTAAPRQVLNNRFAEQRRAKMEARKASPFADRYQHPRDRDADRLATNLTDVQQTPEMLVVSAILRSLDEATAAKVLDQLAPAALSDRPAHRQAYAIAQASRLNLGQQFDLLRALDRLNAEGR